MGSDDFISVTQEGQHLIFLVCAINVDPFVIIESAFDAIEVPALPMQMGQGLDVFFGKRGDFVLAGILKSAGAFVVLLLQALFFQYRVKSFSCRFL